MWDAGKPDPCASVALRPLSATNSTFNRFPEVAKEKYDPKVIQRALQPSRLQPAKERKKRCVVHAWPTACHHDAVAHECVLGLPYTQCCVACSIDPRLVDRPAFKPSSGPKSRLSKSIAHAGYHVATAGLRRSMGRRR